MVSKSNNQTVLYAIRKSS